MFEREWLPSAIAIGISYFDFWQMNPRIIKVMTEGYKKKKLERDEELWRAGLYNYIAFSTAMANAFSKHGRHKYLEKPLLQEAYEKDKPLSEKELKKQRELFAAKLMTMQANFELSHPKKEKENTLEKQSGEPRLEETEENPA